MKRYDPKQIEPKWQQIWSDSGLYVTGDDKDSDYYYNLTMFPYPSGDLHTGHWYAYTAPDVLARFHRMHGKNVLFPMGWDAFGLPAENAAIKRKIAPAKWTRSNIAGMKDQLGRMGASFDWSKELSTADPEYYRWTQWLFLQLYKEKLAYREKGLQNWCPSCQTVLANEQVVGEDRVCERCGTPVEKKELEQWFFKITDYAEDLLDGLDSVDWPEKIKTMQRNWIGRSEGAKISFPIDGSKKTLDVFTTRPDTLFGATFMVLAPEHPLTTEISPSDHRQKVTEYVQQSERQREVDRLNDERAKTGVFTGAYARNPLNNERIPIWVADYVLMSYGTGAIMAVPAHDQRDYDFAKAFDLPVKTVVEPVTGKKQLNPQFRRSIVAILEDDKGRLLSINWGSGNGGNLFVGGGIEKDEDPVDCAQREIAEETGYTDVEFVAQTEIVHHHYFAFSKNVAREIEATGLHFRLKSKRRNQPKLDQSEQGKFQVEWLTRDQAAKQVADELHKHVYKRLILGEVYTGEGKLTASDKYDGFDTDKARKEIVRDLVSKRAGQVRTEYKLRDWLISRQRYWGAPIPIIYCESCGVVPVPEADLPVMLPEDVEFEPTGQSPLLKREDFVNTNCPACDAPARREVDTMDTFVDSSWYFLRFPSPHYEQGAFDPRQVKKWLPVDHYLGGIEHAILHLLYSRFITKFLRDHGGLEFDEPFEKLTAQGMVLGPDGQKMSKSRGNVVSPDHIIDSGYGADSFRAYLLFLGPWEEGSPFRTEGLAGTFRFLNRVWSLVQEYIASDGKQVNTDNLSELETRLDHYRNTATRKVTDEIAGLRYNTALAALMEYVNGLYKVKRDLPVSSVSSSWAEGIGTLLQLLAPFAPHISEELWSQLGNEASIHVSAWPSWEEDSDQVQLVTVVVQVNGKVRAQVSASSESSDAELEHLAMGNERIKELIGSKKIDKTIVVPGKLVNFVVK